jgi:pimeloyl-ACP methyl ester carboxylesterase
MTIRPEEWRARGRLMDTLGGRIFALDAGGTGTGQAVLILHGFPTSSWDFADAAATLARDRRVILFDFLGFGFSEKPRDAAYSILEQADVAISVARQFGVKRAHVWAHDMGASVATELLARRERGLLPFDLVSAIVMNAGIHMEMSHPTIGQRLLVSPAGGFFARMARKPMFVAQMRRLFGRQPPADVLDGMWSLIAREDGAGLWPKTLSFMEERRRFRLRWIGALERVDVPVLIAWGAKDPVTRLAIAERLVRETPGADMIPWSDLGHYPHVEDPARVAAAVEAFFARVEA